MQHPTTRTLLTVAAVSFVVGAVAARILAWKARGG